MHRSAGARSNWRGCSTTRSTTDEALARELNPLSLERTPELQRGGAQLLDTREPAQFEGDHLRGSVNVALGGSYASWCGAIVDGERAIVLIAEPGRELECATRLVRIGFDNVAGYLAGGMEPVDRAPELIERTERITAGSLAEQVEPTGLRCWSLVGGLPAWEAACLPTAVGASVP